ncbi:MAG TPA: helix-turn-helix transcriptional regulator [Chitinophagaceae bacterium]|nr:helix-turn-helix transcriptional regulator [Chitinophagaceae bacterium]
MKIVPFQIPKNVEEAFKVQVDDMPHLYDHLHQHPEIQLTLIKESHGTLIAGDYVGPFHAGDVFVIGSNQPHVFRNDEKFFKKKSRAVAITIFFDESTLGEQFWQLQETKSMHQFFMNSAGGFRIAGKKKRSLTEKLFSIINSEGIEKLITFLEIIKLLNNKKEMQPLSKPIIQRSIRTFDGNRLNKIIEFTFREYQRVITLHEVAALANLTPEAFCKYFKTRTRKTYVSFLNEIRINHACRLLTEEKSIADICYDSGFTNLSNFNRIFRKVKNMSPGQWRRLNAN